MLGRVQRGPLEEPAAVTLHGGICEGGVSASHGGLKRARNWKRWIQPKETYSFADSSTRNLPICAHENAWETAETIDLWFPDRKSVGQGFDSFSSREFEYRIRVRGYLVFLLFNPASVSI